MSHSSEAERSEWWDVAFVHDCGLRRIAARYLVDATGRNGGTLGGSLPRRLVHDRLIGAVQHFAVGLPVSYTLIEATQEGWFFSTSLRDRVLTVIYFTDADLYAKAKGSDSYPTNVLRKASQTWSRINNTDPVGTPLIVSAATSRRPQVSGQGWIWVGDAAQSFDPLSSLGIVKAIDSAARACITVTSTLRRGERSSYQQWSDAVFSQYWQTRHRFYSAEMRWPDSIFWRRRHEETEASRSWEGFAKAP